MNRMIQTWRWFGPNDPVSLQHIKQTGATGIVTALHHIPHGDVWTVEEINKRKSEVEAYGLTWDVVESITVHEDIKTKTGDYQLYIDKYKESIRNVAACGIKIITYNFMPVNDWTRTQLDFVMPDGSEALYFNWVDLAIFDIYILKRENAESSFPENIAAKAKERFNTLNEEQLQALSDVVMFGIPGEKKMTVADMQAKLKPYKNIDRAALRENLSYFLNEICPVADEVGVKLAIHPDDPPFDILGLPRIVNSMEDYDFILSKAPYKSNGICFCTGSLGASEKNDLPQIAKALGDKIHFIHLRNVRRDEEGNFFEADHLDGNVDMYAVVKELLLIQKDNNLSIPFRPDHGHQMLDDLGKVNNPGYSAIGRLRGLAELRGLEEGIIRSL
ncbi:mannonate dehydratase [Flavobacterium chungangense]|uniref:Mannonate dehydratase n=2 Tax=Flavobacterium chungangense TaxID=554283 RepID=A0A6V6Z251_9FLAO|nr:mannonate dehydratase [Flavobacterium chungangense]